MSDDEKKNRLNVEIAHGIRIADFAEDVWVRSTPAGQVRVNRLSHMFIDRIMACNPERVLEIGVGTGAITKHVALPSRVFRAGIDISYHLLKRAPENVPLLVGDIEAFPFKPESFDVVYGCSVLHHLDVKVSLREIHRVLRHNGCLVLSEPNMANPQIFFQKHIMPLKIRLGDVPHETAFFRWSLNRTLKRYGFYEVCIQPFDFLYPWTPERMIHSIASLGQIAERLFGLREIAGSLFITAHKQIL